MSEPSDRADQEVGDRENVPMDVDNLVATSSRAAIAVQSTSKGNTSKMPADGSGDSETGASKSAIGTKRRMTKDDSGISVERSQDNSSSDEEKCDTVKREKSDDANTKDGKSVEDDSEKSSPDSGHHATRFETDNAVHSDDASCTSEGENRSEPRDRNARLTFKDIMNLDSDDSTSPKVTKSEVPAELKELFKKPRLRHKWHLCPEVTRREIGFGNRFQNELFCLRAYGSMHMVERLELMYKMQKHEGCVNTLHFNSSGTRLASSSDDLNVILWDWTVSRPVLSYDSGHRSNVFQAKFIPFSGDCHIVSCARDGQVRLAELSSTGVCKGTRRLAQHRGPAHKLALQFDTPQSFLSVGEDAVIFEIDLRENKPQKLLTCKENDRKVSLYTVYSNPSNVYEFAVGGRDHFVRIYDKRRMTENEGALKTYCPHHLLNSEIRANVTCLVYNYNGTEILASYNDEDIYTFDTSHSTGADFTHKYQGHRNNATVKGVNYFGMKSEYVVSGSDCGNIYLWEHDSSQIVNFMAGDEGGVVNCLEPHPHLPILATSGLDDDIKVWVPSCENPPKLTGLRSISAANQKDREEERRREPETIDGQMLWYFMHHLRRTARRRARQEGQDVRESSSEENSGDSDEFETSDSVQCAPS